VLHAVSEETERAFVKIEQYAYKAGPVWEGVATTLIEGAWGFTVAPGCLIYRPFAVAAEAAWRWLEMERGCLHEPTISALPNSVVAVGIEVGPGHTDEDIANIVTQNIHLPIVLARR
jgi:hypothetical protein